jgi:cephalosporin hydroxylase
MNSLRAFRSARSIPIVGLALWAFGKRIQMHLAARALQRQKLDHIRFDDALEFACSFEFNGITIEPMQIQSQIREMARMLDAKKPATILEVGTAQGGDAVFTCAHCGP